MKRIISLVLLVTVLTGVFGVAQGKTWTEYSAEIVSNAESMIKDFRDAYEKNGSLSKRDIEILYRYYQLWISAKQIYSLASIGYNSIVVVDGIDSYAPLQKVAAETWEQYLSGKIDSKKASQLFIILTDEIGK